MEQLTVCGSDLGDVPLGLNLLASNGLTASLQRYFVRQQC